MCDVFDHLAETGEAPAAKLPQGKSKDAAAHHVCVQAVQIVLGVVNKVFVRVDITMTKLKLKSDTSAFFRLKILSSQIKILADYALQAAINEDPDCILYKPQTDPEWARVRPYYTIDVSFHTVNQS